VDDPLEQFAGVYDRYYRNVLRYSLQHAEQATAEDVTSETFLIAWRRFPALPDPPLPWLLGVANNATRNAQRTLRRHSLLLAKLPPPGEESDIAADAAARVDQERLVEHILAISGQLRKAEREILALCDWNGLSYAEAAVALGIPEGTVRSRLFRARQRLRKLLDSEDAATLQDVLGARFAGEQS